MKLFQEDLNEKLLISLQKKSPSVNGVAEKATTSTTV
jgi:hypothetical protein